MRTAKGYGQVTHSVARPSDYSGVRSLKMLYRRVQFRDPGFQLLIGQGLVRIERPMPMPLDQTAELSHRHDRAYRR